MTGTNSHPPSMVQRVACCFLEKSAGKSDPDNKGLYSYSFIDAVKKLREAWVACSNEFYETRLQETCHHGECQGVNKRDNRSALYISIVSGLWPLDSMTTRFNGCNGKLNVLFVCIQINYTMWVVSNSAFGLGRLRRLHAAHLHVLHSTS